KQRISDISLTIQQMEKRRNDLIEARATKIITERESLEMQAEENAKIVALENQRLSLQAERIEKDFRVTQAQKFDQFQALGLQNLGPNPRSFSDQMISGLVALQNQWGTLQQQIASGFYNTIGGAVNSVSEGITGMIMRTEGWQKRLMQIPFII